MTNIQQEVTNFIEQDVSIRRGLSRGLLNSRALAKYIYKNLNLSCSVDAVISAIRRYDTSSEVKDYIKKRYKIIATAKVSSRTNMISILYKKNKGIRDSLSKIYNQIDFSCGDVIRILEVSQFIKVIVDDKNISYLPKKNIIKTEKKLGEMSIIYSDNVANTPGIFAAISSELALSEISIVDGVIVGNEHIFIVKVDDLMKSLDAVNRVRKWGENVL